MRMATKLSLSLCLILCGCVPGARLTPSELRPSLPPAVKAAPGTVRYYFTAYSDTTNCGYAGELVWTNTLKTNRVWLAWDAPSNGCNGGPLYFSASNYMVGQGRAPGVYTNWQSAGTNTRIFFVFNRQSTNAVVTIRPSVTNWAPLSFTNPSPSISLWRSVAVRTGSVFRVSAQSGGSVRGPWTNYPAWAPFSSTNPAVRFTVTKIVQ
jgi:hypothetical protein